MTIILAKLKNLVKQYQYDAFVLVCMLLVATISYNLGVINAQKKSPLTIRQDADILTAVSGAKSVVSKLSQNDRSAGQGIAPTDSRVVASKAAGSKLYHYSWCSGAQRIKEANRLWFANEKAAITAGYTLAGNCQ